MKYLVKTPWWLKKIYPSYTWDIRTRDKTIYLSFDDGPNEKATPFVLEQLKKYDAKATFFCVGKNVAALPWLYNRILEEGHTTGNHTFNHLNGWKTKDEDYLNDVADAARLIDSALFRPPYGRIKAFQARHIAAVMKTKQAKIVMWDILSGDFDTTITKERCLENVIMNIRSGSIVVFHDSDKAFPLLEYSLPRTLEYLSSNGFRMEAMPRMPIIRKNGEENIVL